MLVARMPDWGVVSFRFVLHKVPEFRGVIILS